MMRLTTLLIAALSFVFVSCSDDGPRVCKQEDFIGSYKGSKKGALCNNSENYVFQVAAGPDRDQIIVDDNIVNFAACDIVTDGTALGLGQEFEGYLTEDDSIVVVQTALGGIVELRCTWSGIKQQ